MELFVSALFDGLENLVKWIEERFGTLPGWIAVVLGVVLLGALILWLVLG